MRKVIFTHYDNWHKTLYLTNNLVFSKNIKDAAIFTILKIDGSDNIVNGDSIYIHLGMQRLVCEDDYIKLVEFNVSHRYIDYFIITDGSSTINPIDFEQHFFLIADRKKKTGLKYFYDIPPKNSDDSNNSIIVQIHERKRHILVNESFNAINNEPYRFMFIDSDILHEIDIETEEPETNVLYYKEENTNMTSFLKKHETIFVIILLLILLLITNRLNIS